MLGLEWTKEIQKKTKHFFIKFSFFFLFIVEDLTEVSKDFIHLKIEYFFMLEYPSFVCLLFGSMVPSGPGLKYLMLFVIQHGIFIESASIFCILEF